MLWRINGNYVYFNLATATIIRMPKQAIKTRTEPTSAVVLFYSMHDCNKHSKYSKIVFFFCFCVNQKLKRMRQ